MTPVAIMLAITCCIVALGRLRTCRNRSS
jgi:hypothetical protein